MVLGFPNTKPDILLVMENLSREVLVRMKTFYSIQGPDITWKLLLIQKLE